MLPAVALGHHVQVRQHGYGLLPRTDLRVAAVAVDVARLHAQTADVRHRGIQRAAHLSAKGRVVRAPVRAHARHADPALQRFNHVALERSQRRVQLFIGFEFHRSFLPMSMFVLLDDSLAYRPEPHPSRLRRATFPRGEGMRMTKTGSLTFPYGEGARRADEVPAAAGFSEEPDAFTPAPPLSAPAQAPAARAGSRCSDG